MWNEDDLVDDENREVYLKCQHESPCAVEYINGNKWTEFHGRPKGLGNYEDEIVGEIPLNEDGTEADPSLCPRICAEDPECTAFYHNPDYETEDRSNDECLIYKNENRHWAVAKSNLSGN